MTPAQSPASAPAGTGAGTGPPRQDIPADQGGPAARTSGSGRSSYKRLRTGPSNWLLAPALRFFGVFALLPLLGVVVLSFFAWDGLGTAQLSGVSASIHVCQEPLTMNVMQLTLLLTVLSYVVQFPLSPLLGAFRAGHRRYREVFSVLYFLPLLFSAAAVGITFKALQDPNFGMSRAFGLDFLRQDWLGSPNLAFYTRSEEHTSELQSRGQLVCRLLRGIKY